MVLREKSSKQKQMGAYYTPPELAYRMTDILTKGRNITTALEPSCGEGVFIEALYKTIGKKEIQTTAVEINPEETLKLKEKWKAFPEVTIYNEDFFSFCQKHKNNRYDLIIGNPPYIRYQYLSKNQREQVSELLKEHGMKANRLSNAWIGFMTACITILGEAGQIAFVIPAEIIHVSYAMELREYLLRELSSITLVSFRENAFPGLQQEVLIFIGEKGKEKKGIRIVELEDISQLTKIILETRNYQEVRSMEKKWTCYYLTEAENALISKIRTDKRFQKLSDVSTINIGITTGNNKYFAVNRETAELYDLRNISVPLISKGTQIHSVCFSEKDWECNRNSGKPVYLVNFSNCPVSQYTKRQQAYIEMGKKNGYDKGYKCSIRDKWYQVPYVWSPDAFFLRRSQQYPRFALNQSEAVCTDILHRVTFTAGEEPEYIVLSYYNSISFAFTELCGRSYGGGVLELFPTETGNIYLPVITGMSDKAVKNLLQQVDAYVREDNIEAALDLVDTQVLQKQLGIPEQSCMMARNIWKKLRKRRTKKENMR